MRISVESDQCAGIGQCHEVDPELFPLDDDGYSAVGKDRDVPADKEEKARIGVDSCPMAALFITE
ncbi:MULTISPECIES: ferredoxin [Thermocrispum]|jgi:ferredoxin|uniref:Ferredoxin n=1 Tax=Thermocrispum agreste TaxID=37925 RepID=A0A2W4LED5_9PSEU|nr:MULTISPECIES: ferredoxin [Thermocrispum]PZM95893.1 MAG: ferredoxin [Thermocrispum agreste]